MTKQFSLQCQKCQHTFPYQPGAGACPHCDHDWLDPQYDLQKTSALWQAELAARPPTMWRYWELLPLLERRNIVSMGEGYTPLLPLPLQLVLESYQE